MSEIPDQLDDAIARSLAINQQPYAWLHQYAAHIDDAALMAELMQAPREDVRVRAFPLAMTDALPYPWCRQPAECAVLGYCPRDPNCGE